MAIVLKLLLSHEAQYVETNHSNYETILHVACRLKSALRYIYILAFPSLLTVPDSNGNCPIHTACEVNDTEFVSWLFKSILSKEEVPNAAVSFDASLFNDNIAPDFAPDLSFVSRASKFTAANAQGHTVYHIAVSKGYCQLLSLLLDITELMPDEFELGKVVAPDLDEMTPIDMAIAHLQPKCLSLLLHFLNKHGSLQKVMHDKRFMVSAADIGSMDIMKQLVKYGFRQGLEYSIGKVQDEQLKRLLFYYYTQLTSVQVIMDSQPNNKIALKVGQIKWNAASTKEVSVDMINDCFSAMESIAIAISECEKAPISLDDLCMLQNLTSKCLSYIESGKPCAFQINSNPLIPITVVNITQCTLRIVAPELFRLPKLEVLNLSDNNIQDLPTAVGALQCIYSSSSLKSLVLDGNQLKMLPEDLLLGLANSLEHLSVQRNELTELPPGLWIMPHLKKLNLARNKLSQLHYFSDRFFMNNPVYSRRVLDAMEICNYFGEIESLLPKRNASQNNTIHYDIQLYLQRLQIFFQMLNIVTGETFSVQIFKQWVSFLNEQWYSQDVSEQSEHGSQFQCPKIVFNVKLTYLNLSRNNFTNFPKELPCLVPNLKELIMSYNKIKDLNLIGCMPSNIATISLDHNVIESLTAAHSATSFCLAPCMIMQLEQIGCNHTAHTTLKSLSNLQLGYNNLKDFCPPIFDEIIEDYSVVCTSVVQFPQLSVLSLEHNMLTSVPSEILHITSLNSLNLAHNAGIVHLPSKLGLLPLYGLNLEGLLLADVPITKNTSTIELLAYLKGIHQG